jgi:predicted transposase/invertase (TIGR01784 family)
LGIADVIVDLYYGNTVRTGLSKDDRTSIFDLYCTTGKGDRIIVEMQTVFHDYYRDRALYYASRLIQEQGKKSKHWDFMLYPVYSVNILNFCLDKTIETEKYVSQIQLIDRDTHQLFYDKLTFVYLELPRFTKNENGLQTEVEQWMYALKYLPKLDRLPFALRNEVFEKLFEHARIAKMSRREQNNYYKSLHDMGIVRNQISKMENTIAARDNTIAALTQNNTALIQDNAASKNTIASLQKELADLRRQTGRN